MALFQDEQINEEEFNKEHNLNKKPDIFSNLGYDDIIKERNEIRNQKAEEEQQWVKNIVSPDKIDSWKQQGSMTAIQVWHKKNKNELVPYMGTWKSGSKSFNIKNISDKIQTGQTISPEERQQFENFVLDLAEVQTRGYSFGGGAMNIGLETIPFMAEFALGLLTSGGTSSVGATASKLSTEFLKKGLTKQVIEGVGKTAFNATINPRTYAFTATRLPQQVRARMGDIMLSDSLAISPEGQAILKESEESPAKAFMKALALTNIEVASEVSGQMLVRPLLQTGSKLGKVIASPVLKMLPEGFSTKFVKLAEEVTKLPFVKAVDDLGFNGILEEMGEERIGDLLQFAFNLDGEDGYSFEQLLDALFPSPQQLGQEALSFGVTGLGMNALHNGIKALPKAGEKYSKDGFLIDAGIFRVAGYDSYLDSKVKETLKKQDKSEEEIDNALEFSTRDDKIQFLKETKTEFDTKKEYDDKEFEKDLKREEVEDKTYNKFLQGGVEQDVAYANAKLFGQFFRKYGADNIQAFDDWYKKFDVQYNVPASNGNVMHQFIGPEGAENFDNKLLTDLEDAKKMDSKNILSHTIREQTGWFKGSDNKWRYEISDKDAKIINEDKIKYHDFSKEHSLEDFNKKIFEYNNKLSALVKARDDKKISEEDFSEQYGSIMDEKLTFIEKSNNARNNYESNVVLLKDILQHDKLYKAYPDLANLEVHFVSANAGYGGRFTGDSIEIPADTIEFGNIKSILMHEIQHYIQDSESFARGGNPDSMELVIKRVLQKIDNSPEERKRKALVKELENVYKESSVLGNALQVLRVHEKPEAMFKTWWWAKHGSWYVPRKTRKKEYRAFMQEWTDKFLQGVIKDMKERDELDKYQDYVSKDIEELKRLYRNLEAKKRRLWYKIPRDISEKFRKAVVDLGNARLEFQKQDLKIELYKRLAGEVEARNTQTRMDMSEDERKEKSPKSTQDYEDNDQLVVFSDGTTVSYSPINNNAENTEKVNTFFQSAFHGSPHMFDKFSTEHIGSGEGAQAHGWGLYFAKNKEISEKYRKELLERRRNNYKISIDGKQIDKELVDEINNQYGSLLYRATNDIEGFRTDIKKYIQDLKQGDKIYNELIDLFSEEIRKIEANPKMSIAEFLRKVPKEHLYRFKTTVEIIKKQAKNNKEKATIQDVLKNLYDARQPFLDIRKDEKEFAEKLEKYNWNNAKVEEESGQLFEVDIPEDSEMIDEQKTFEEQSDSVKQSLSDLFYGEKIDSYIQEKIDFFNEQLNDIEQEAIEIGGYSTQMNYDAGMYEAELKFLESISNFENLKKLSGKNIYQSLSNFFGSDKEASIKLNEYGIKGISYNGIRDGRSYVVFDDKSIETLKTYYQEAEESEEKLIAGFTYQEVLDKMTSLYDELEKGKLDKKSEEKILAKIHILEDAFEVSENPNKFSNEDQRTEKMLNAFYVMNNQEIPEEYVEADAISQRSYKDLKDIHDKKKADAEAQYYGYFSEGQNKNIITIMANHNSSTALHELGHLFLNGLNELAKTNEDARKQLDAVNKWLGFSGEYTVAQQEKFARSFEAYLYKGKAPNNYLRQVFENFKEWLKSVYNQITDLENKGADISPEVQEMFDNMFSSDEYYQERKEANALLRKVKSISRRQKLEKIPVRDEKSLTDTQKRCKEISYQILSVATGKDIKYLKRIFETSSNKNGYATRREVVEELLEKVDDKITTSGGMREEWREFYADTGVSYDNDEVGGDMELAEQALTTIINKDYYDPEVMIKDRLTDEAEYFKKAIDDADREYQILLRSFKKENRNVALSAIYEWLEKLPEQIRQDYEDRFIFDSGIIERNENVDKFDKAKRQILSKAMEIENKFSISSDEGYRELVQEVMKNLDFLQPSDKAKLTANILDVPSTPFLMSSIDNILDIAKTMEDVNLRRNLEREIHKELQQTKNVKKNGRSVGKYDYRSNKFFEELRDLDRLSPERANELRLESSKFATAEENGLSQKDKLINKFLSYKAGGRTFADTELMKELYDEIVKIKLAGKSAKSELELTEKLNESKDIEELISIVENKKDAGFAIKAYINGIANLESTLNAIFNADIKDRYGAEILYAETQSQAWQHEQKQQFEKGVAKIYNLPSWCWDKKILEYLNEKHTFSEIRRRYDANGELIKARNIDRTLTKMDIIQAFIWSKNEVLEKRLQNQFGEETLENMFELLSEQDEKLAELMMQTAQSFYPLVNKAFINKYGLDLPKVSCYFPSTPERGSEVDLYNDYSSKALGNGFTKARAMSETQAMDFHNPVATLYSHIEGVGKFVFMSDSLDKANLRFKDLDLKRVIVNKYGEDAYRTLEQSLMNITYKKEAPVFNGMNKVLDNMIGNWIQANIAIKPIVGLKQLLSANNYAVDMPYMTWQTGFLKALANPKETIDYMMKIPYIKARYEGSYSNEFLKQTIENSAFATSKKLKDFCTLFVRIGDIGAIIFGGKPYIDYMIKERGLSEEEAIKQFVLSTNRSQQSSAISSLSNFQVNMTRNPMGKLFIAYKNSPQQYVRMCGDAIVSVANGDISKEKCAKLLFQYGYLQPFFYAVATSGSLLRFLFTGDDDDLLKDASISIFDMNASALPLLGDIYLYALNKVVYKEKFLPQTTPLLGDIQQEIGKMAKKDATLADYLEGIGYLSLHVGLGYNAKALQSMSSGVGDVVTGEPVQGAMKVLGYTDKKSKHIAGNEKKKKK